MICLGSQKKVQFYLASSELVTLSKSEMSGVMSGNLYISSVGFSVAVTVGSLLVWRSMRQNRSLKLDLSSELPDEISKELYSRVRTYFGDDGFAALQGASVVVVGLGGVGSHAANMLARSGVRHLRLIDFDQVTLSSLNRHALATMEDVGISKAAAVKKRLLGIVPWCNIENITEMFVADNAERLLTQGIEPIFVLDCIDDVNTKAELLHFCKQKSLKVITSMGAGGKSDPTKLCIGTLGDVVKDPLASKMKWKLKKLGLTSDDIDDIMTVYSAEKPQVELLPLSDEQHGNPQDFGAVEYLRLRVIPVLGTSPAVFGQSMASFVLCQIAGKPYAPEACERMSKNLRQKVLKMLKKDEDARFGAAVVDDDNDGHKNSNDSTKKTNNNSSRSMGKDLGLDEDDMELLVQQVWGGRCCISGKRFGGHNPLALVRWNPAQPPTLDNLVLLASSESTRLASEGLAGFPVEKRQAVEQRLAWVRATFAAQHATVPAPLSAVDLDAAASSVTRRLIRLLLTCCTTATMGGGGDGGLPLGHAAAIALGASSATIVFLRFIVPALKS